MIKRKYGINLEIGLVRFTISNNASMDDTTCIWRYKYMIALHLQTSEIDVGMYISDSL